MGADNILTRLLPHKRANLRPDFSEIVLTDLSPQDVNKYFPPGNWFTIGDQDTPFGQTVPGVAAYVDKNSRSLILTNINGNVGKRAECLYIDLRPMK
jgi:hypothetical protein